MSEQALNRVQILIQQNRYKEANEAISNLMLTNPDNVDLLSWKSLVSLELGDTKTAMETIDAAIGIAPDIGYFYYLKSRVFLHKESMDEAEEMLNTARNIDPENADFHALHASIKLARKKYDEALSLSDQALELDGGNLLALNTRGKALLKLNRKEESHETIQGALKEDPNNAFTHSNYGWNLLEKGDPKKAMEHFAEALKNDPNLEFAQGGMVEAMKARFWFYRLYLKYSFWMGNLTAKYQWGVLIGFYVVFKGLRTIASKNEFLQPYLTPIIVLLAIMAFSTWVINPIGNLLLRLNKFGKHLLDEDEIKSSNLVGISLLVSVVGLLGYFITGHILMMLIGIFGFAMMVPFSTMFKPSKYGNSLFYYAVGMALVGVLALVTTVYSGDLTNQFSVVFFFGFIAYQWIANFLMIQEDNI